MVVSLHEVIVKLDNKTVIDRLSLEVSFGEKVTLSGESGCGKSTLLKTIIGMHLPETGEIHINNTALSLQQQSFIRRQMFYLPQDIISFGDETCEEYLRYPFTLSVNKGCQYSVDHVKQVFDQLRLSVTLLDQPFLKLSGGERKRIGIALGLLLNRSIMLLDEPTAGIDAVNRKLVAELLHGLSDVTILAVTHDKDLINRFDRTIEMTKSEEEYNGST